MTSHRISSMVVGFALVLAGCGAREEGSFERCAPTDALLAEIERHRVLIDADRCWRDASDPSVCETREIAFAPSEAPVDPRGRDETILVVDDFPRLTTSMYRYRDRIEAYVRATNEGTIADVPFVWSLPTQLVETYDALGIPSEISAAWLTPLAAPLREAYPQLLTNDVIHGAFVFALLVEPSPRRSLVLLDRLGYTTFASDVFCAPASDDTVVATLRTRAEGVAVALRALMAAHDVRYVNYSGGWSMPSMRAVWNTSCAGPAPSDAILYERLMQMRPVLDVLFATPGVVAAQAADDSVNAFEFPFDQPIPAFTNRVRVGFFEALASGLDAVGRGASRNDGWPSTGTADVWLNSGVLSTRPFPFNETPLERVDAFGTSRDPVTLTTTSWIAPLATSRLVHLRESRHADATFDQTLVDTLLDELVPSVCGPLANERCRYQDPLLHRQSLAELEADANGCDAR